MKAHVSHDISLFSTLVQKCLAKNYSVTFLIVVWKRGTLLVFPFIFTGWTDSTYKGIT